MATQVPSSAPALRKCVIAIAPAGVTDEKLVLGIAKSSALAVLDLGHEWRPAYWPVLKRLSLRIPSGFAIRLGEGFELPDQFASALRGAVNTVIFSTLQDHAFNASRLSGVSVLCEVVSLEEALAADAAGLQGLIVKGNEAGGRVGELASFIFMQQVAGRLTTPYWVAGGMGPHGAAAAVYAGAQGVVYDSQLALMGSYGRHPRIGPIVRSLNGSETEIAHGYRYLKHGLLQALDGYPDKARMLGALRSPEKLDREIVLAGIDIALAELFQKTYGDPQTLVHLTETSIDGAIHGNLVNCFTEGSLFAQSMGLRFPILQGPMTRVSDVADFAVEVARGGALPSIACAVLAPDKLDEVLTETARKSGGLPWAAGVLAFLPPALLKHQMDVVVKHKPHAVVLAGGRSDQCKYLTNLGITPIVHCPTEKLFQQFLKDGVQHFIFEGRECGGHIGPLSSMVLWELQITTAMEAARPEKLHLIFAGGIHDELSSRMVSVMCSKLAPKGVRLGVLMGTAYIFCEEAVRTGAILQNFQDRAVQGRETAVVETGVGHITRCLKTGYVDILAARRAEMEQRGLSKSEIFVELEKLNVGHLRIASKGVRREGDRLISVPLEEQNASGMFMIGDVALMRDRVTTIGSLHAGVAAPGLSAARLDAARARLAGLKAPDRANCAIAVVGMAAQFAGSTSIDEYWLNIIEGRDLVTEVDDRRWSKQKYFDPENRTSENEKSYSKWGGFIRDFVIDPVEFGIPPQTLCSIDPGQLAALRVAKDALLDAGYADPDLHRNTSVIFGYEPGGEVASAYGLRILMNQVAQDHPEVLDDAREHFPRLTEDSFAGVLGNVVAGRVSNRLNLGGQNFTIDAACASSLAAIDAAIKELRYGQSDMVIAGGVDFHNGIQDYVMFCSTYALSHKGKCLSFSDEADGIALAEGMAAVVLKRLEDAQADGDRIYAVIEGIAGSSDGKSLGLTAPRRQGQKSALHRAYQRAGVSPRQIGLVEAHGTGTVAGDKTELSALEEVYQWAGALNGSVSLGSVKTQIGHTKCAAGIASLIKCVLATRYGVVTPTLHIDRPNRHYDPANSPFSFNNRAIPWLEDERLAAVSAFGFGGTNYHAVISAPQGDGGGAADGFNGSLAAMTPNLRSHELFVFAAASRAPALDQVSRLMAFIHGSTAELSLARLSASQFKALEAGQPVQIAIVASDLDDLNAKLALAVSGQHSLSGVYLRGPNADAAGSKEVAFLFAGQGSQFVDMGRELFIYFPELRSHLAGAGPLTRKLFPSAVHSEQERARQLSELTATDVAQPMIGAVSQAVAQLLSRCGIHAGAAAGHSYGELAAVGYAGGFSPNRLVPLSQARARAILDSSTAPGAMIAVACGAAETEALLQGATDFELGVANLNSPSQTVLSGSRDAVAKAKAYFAQRNVKASVINTPVAFHSELIRGADEKFATHLGELSTLQPDVVVWSNLTAEPYEPSTQSLRTGLSRQIVSAVRYQSMIEGMHDRGARVFVEVGPGAIQTQLVKEILGSKPGVTTIATVQRNQSALRSVLQAMAQMTVIGVDCNFGYLFANRRLKTYDLGKPETHRASAWLVNGHRARPVTGDIPPHGFDPSRAGDYQLPKGWGNAMAARAVPAEGDSREQVLNSYFTTMNHFVEQQKNVMLQYLGAAPARPVSLSVPAPVPTPAAPIRQTSVAVVMPVAASAAIIGSASLPTVEQMRHRVIAAIAQKTGYPIEMIEPGLDLESDLGIDSIKRMELLASLAESLGVALDAGAASQADQDTTELLKEVASLKSAEQIAGWLQATMSRSSRQPVALTLAASTSTATPVAAAGPMVTPVVVAASATLSVLAAPLPTVGETQDRVIAAIAQKTGYPVEMIEPGLDLESDLGIDSIKRMELLATLAESLGVPMDASAAGGADQDTTELLKEVASLKSAEQIASWLHGMMSRTRHETVEASAASAATAVIVSSLPAVSIGRPTAPRVTVADVQAILVQSIVRNTGYPAEIVEPDLDLEADLGVDSIKRMTLLQEVTGELGLADTMSNDTMQEEQASRYLETLSKLKTVRQISEWLVAQIDSPAVAQVKTQTAGSESPALPTSNGEEAPVQSEFEMRRYETRYLPCEIEPASAPVVGRKALVISDMAVDAFCGALAERGHVVTTVRLGSVATSDCADQEAIVFALDQSQEGYVAFERFREVFLSIQSLDPKNVASLTVIGHARGENAADGSGYRRPLVSAGLSGLIAALRREWPKVSITCFFEHGASGTAEQAAWVDHLYAEHGIDGYDHLNHEFRPAAYENGRRYRRQLMAVSVETSDRPVIDRDDVIVVIGGAKGITQWTTADLAKVYGCHFVLIGRTCLDEQDIDTLAIKDKAAIRRESISAHAGKMPIGEVESLIAKEVSRHQMVAGLREIRQYANSVSYFAADTNDAEALKRAMLHVVATHGRITGCIYGAGVIRDKFIGQKTLDDARSVYEVKTRGYLNFVEAVLAVSEPRFVMAYSSISAVLGNRGQTDYGAANKALENISLSIGKAYPATRFSTIGWGPWSGTGMIDQALEEHLSRYDIFAIRRDEGSAFLINELQAAHTVDSCSYAFKKRVVSLGD